MSLERPPKEDLQQKLSEMTNGDTARHYGVSRGTITRWRICYGLMPNNDRLPSKEQLEVCIDSGMPATEICKKYGISQPTLSARMTAFEIKTARRRREAAIRNKVINALKIPRTLGDLSQELGMKVESLSAYLCSLKRSGLAATVGEHMDGRGLWGIPDKPEEVGEVKIDLLIAASNAPQYVGLIEHQLNSRR